MPATLGDATIVNESGMRTVSLSGAFGVADGDALTITAAFPDGAKATVTVAADQPKLAVAGMAEVTAVITVTAQASGGNRASDQFEVKVRPAFERGESAIPCRSPGSRTH